MTDSLLKSKWSIVLKIFILILAVVSVFCLYVGFLWWGLISGLIAFIFSDCLKKSGDMSDFREVIFIVSLIGLIGCSCMLIYSGIYLFSHIGDSKFVFDMLYS